MENQFLRQLSRFSGKTILLAVSGGVDSVVLLRLFSKTDFRFAVAHVNFQLRGTASDEDESFVRQLAASCGKQIFVTRVQTNNYATEHGVSIQMAARDLRYAWFEEVMASEKFDLLATAHHLTDSLETTLVNFTRGSGLAGITGIPEFTGAIIRPLIHFPKDEIEKYAVRNDLVWREDSSNATDDYDRNFIRHQIVPKLRELNPSLEKSFARTQQRLLASRELANRALDDLRQKYTEEKSGIYIIQKQLLAEVSHPSGILWELVKEFGFNFSQCSEAADAARGQPGRIFLAPGSQLTIDRETIIVSPTEVTPGPVAIGRGQPEATFGSRGLTISEGGPDCVSRDQAVATLDAGKLVFPLVWRTWAAGDFFQPLGMSHRKKISDFLVDRKVPVHEKRGVTVLESAGEIAWVVGHRIDDRFKITPETVKALTFELV